MQETATTAALTADEFFTRVRDAADARCAGGR